MEINLITEKNVNLYSYSNIQAMQFPIHSITISLHGWYESKMRDTITDFETELANNHVLCIYPYYSEWSWMNFPTINLIDDIVGFYIKQYALSDNIPIIVFGKSMGGLSALIYTLYSARTPIACAANCPICNLPLHIKEREDLPRTIYAAYGGYHIPLEIAMELHSPIHQVEKMPHIPYYIVHGYADTLVNKVSQSDSYVSRLKELNYDIEYHEVVGMKHCDFRSCPEERSHYQNFIMLHSCTGNHNI